MAANSVALEIRPPIAEPIIRLLASIKQASCLDPKTIDSQKDGFKPKFFGFIISSFFTWERRNIAPDFSKQNDILCCQTDLYLVKMIQSLLQSVLFWPKACFWLYKAKCHDKYSGSLKQKEGSFELRMNQISYKNNLVQIDEICDF